MAIPILAAAGAAAARTAGTQIAKGAAKQVAKTAAKEAAKQAAKESAKRMIKQGAADAARRAVRKEPMISPSGGAATKPRVEDAAAVPVPKEETIKNTAEERAERNDKTTPAEELLDEGYGEVPAEDVEEEVPAQGNDAEEARREAKPQAPAAAPIAAAVAVVPTKKAASASASDEGLARGASSLGGKTAKPSSAGAMAQTAAKQSRAVATPPKPAAKGGLKGALGNAGKAGSLLNKGGLKGALGGGSQKNASNPVADAAKGLGKGALAALTVLNPFFWLTMLFFTFLLFIILFVSSCSAGLFGGSGTETIENEDTTFIPTVETAGYDPCANLTTDEAREAAGCDDGERGHGDTHGWTYFNQITPNWSDWDGTSFGSSCGQVAAAMVFAKYGGDPEKYTPNWLRTTEMRYGDQGLNQPGVVNYINTHQDEFGLKATSGHWCANSPGWDEIKRVCDGGGCAILYQVHYSSGGMHWVTVYDVDGDDVTVANPASGKEEVFSKAEIIADGCPNGSGGPADVILCEKI